MLTGFLFLKTVEKISENPFNSVTC